MEAVITNVGTQQAAIAAANGVRISISTFAIGTGGPGVAPTGNEVALAAQVYSGSVDSVRWVSETEIEVDCFVPSDEPATGTWGVDEAGLFLEDGTLFAYATFDIVTKESSSELMLRWFLVLTGGASALTVEPSGDSWTVNFRGTNLLDNSDFRALGNGDLANDNAAVVFAEDRPVCQYWRTYQGGFSVRRDADNGLKITSQDIISPAYLIQDLDRRIVEEAAGDNLVFRIKARHTTDDDRVELGFIIDRGSSPITIDTTSFQIDADAWAEYSVTVSIPSDAESVAVCIGPETTNEVYVKWAVCNLEDEEIRYARVPGEKWPIPTIDPELTAAEVDTLLGELTAGSDYPSVLMLPGNYDWDANVDGSNVTSKSFGDVIVTLDGAVWTAERIECDRLEVDTTNALDDCFEVTEATGHLIISGGHRVTVGMVEFIDSDDEVIVEGDCKHVEADGLVQLNSTTLIYIDTLIAKNVNANSQSKTGIGVCSLTTTTTGFVIDLVAAGPTMVSMDEFYVNGGAAGLHLNSPSSGNEGLIELRLGKSYLDSVTAPFVIEVNSRGSVDIGEFVCEQDENSYCIYFAENTGSSTEHNVPSVRGALRVRGTGTGGAGTLYGLMVSTGANNSAPILTDWDLQVYSEVTGGTIWCICTTYQGSLRFNRFVVDTFNMYGSGATHRGINIDGASSCNVFGNRFEITGATYSDRLLFMSGSSAAFYSNEVIFRMIRSLSGAGVYGIYLNPGAGNEANVIRNLIRGTHANTGAHGTWGGGANNYYYLRGNYNMIDTMGDWEIGSGAGNDDESTVTA